jgi:5-(carboxyamino)imidazole ribonucleotide synthase
MTTEPLPPGSTIGILGGGQLGRMLALAAARLGMKTHIYCPDPQSPAFDVTPRKTVAAYEDKAALFGFADAVDIVTYEFENVPAETARFLDVHKPLRPNARALVVAHDRLAEKSFLQGLGIPVTPFRPVLSLEDLQEGLAALGTPAVLKTTRLGYDGKGQRIVQAGDDLGAAFESLAPKPLVLEAFVAFAKEISVVVARGADGAVAAYDPAENVHRDHILATSTVPAAIAPGTATEARRIAETIVSALDYVGVLGVEFFVLPTGAVLVNEIAPRVHNSGHWTEAVCVTDQFEQHIRAVCGWPLGDVARLADVVMRNLIGDEILGIPDSLTRGVRPQLYGKAEARPGRKMGHLNQIAIESARK